MAMMSDWDGGDSTGHHPATCGRCRRTLSTWPTAQEAADAELNHQLQRHPATLEDSGGGAASGSQAGRGKPAKLTRDQTRNKFRKPGTK